MTTAATPSPPRRAKSPAPAGPRPVRCAIYTRKSTDEGLNMDFNSLDAQREAAEAFILSQRHEGWVALPEPYDDGGFSGGSLERPAVKRLLADVEAGKVDCIVVYKVDRLSRSLLDFSRIMETLERHGCSFVSVTQQFNTTHSMGRLTLNILLSFAQFEREIISERTRDKMRAARAKGKWVGGGMILGYDVAPGGGRLVVNPDEAERVRRIFKLFIEKGAVLATATELNRRGWGRKVWTTRDGRPSGGRRWDKGNLRATVTNPAYIGLVRHKGALVLGEHEPIIDRETWDRAQAVIKRNRGDRGASLRNKHGALLRGLLWCGTCGVAMHHCYSQKKRALYRYYVCHNALKSGWATCATKSVPAIEIERFVVEHVRATGNDPDLVAEVAAKAREQAAAAAKELREEDAALRAALRAAAREVANYVGAPDCARRLADLQERIKAGEGRLAEIAAALRAKEGAKANDNDVARALAAFDGSWQAMETAARARLLALLIERVTYDGAASKLSLTFRPNGFAALADELP